MDGEPAHDIRRWRNAWIALACALAVHVTDEALTGFLPAYNQLVRDFRTQVGWAPFPTFTFPVWLIGLALGITLLFAATPYISRGRSWLRVLSLILSVIMIGNALGHIAASLYWRRLAPGSISSPLLLVAALALFVAARRVGKRAPKTEPHMSRARRPSHL